MAGVEQPETEYERDRQERIARNRQVLEGLGLLANPLSGAAAEQGRRQPRGSRQQPAERAEPVRKSRRLQAHGERWLPDENTPLEDDCDGEQGAGRPRAAGRRRLENWCVPVMLSSAAMLPGPLGWRRRSLRSAFAPPRPMEPLPVLTDDPGLDQHNFMRRVWRWPTLCIPPPLRCLVELPW